MKLHAYAAVILFTASVLQAEPVRVMRRESGGTGGGAATGTRSAPDVSRDAGRDAGPRVERSAPSASVTRTGPTRVVRRNYSPARHDTVIRNRTVVRDIHRQQRTEVVPNRYYWHTARGVRYAHTIRGGIHWYGFYRGPRFYWSRYYLNNWWWYDAAYSRWAFWANGYWWWPGPGNVMYVYVNDNYYPYDSSDVPVAEPSALPASPSDMPASSQDNPDSTVKSPDGQRMVQIVGAYDDAFLYDNSGKTPVFLKSLGNGVSQARFFGGTEGKALQILVDYSDGHFVLYSKDGETIQNSSAPASPAAPSPTATTATDSEEPPFPPPGL